MKPLILILLVALSVEAQSLPEIARQERERKAAQKASRVFTSDDARAAGKGVSLEPEKPAAPAAAAAPAVPATNPAAKPVDAAKPAAPAKPADDPVKKYNEELSKLRAKVVALQDQETALQLRLNDMKNQYLAPVTDSSARAAAESARDQAQNELKAAQDELAATRRSLQLLEAQGPPRPQK